MAHFNKGGAGPDPFGKNAFLRSTQDVKWEPYTLAASTVALETVNGVANQKVLQSGEILAKITSGPEIGKVGPFQRGSGAAGSAAVNEVQTLTRTATGGTVTLAFNGSAVSATVPSTAGGFTNAAVQAALEGLSTINPGDVVVAGGAGGPLTVTFQGALAGANQPLIVVDNTLATGGTVTNAETTPGAAAGVWAGAPTDGRGEVANIVGINGTFLPWQLLERDVEVAAAYECTAVQGWCFERDAAGVRGVLSNSTADAMRGTKGLDVHFK